MDNGHLERITEALYKVTDRMNDSEELKWKLRKAALEFEEIASSNQDRISYENKEKGMLLLKSVERMLKLAMTTSYVARVNFETLLREYGALDQAVLPGGKEVDIPKTKEKTPEPTLKKEIKEVVVDDAKQVVESEPQEPKKEEVVSREGSPNVSIRQERVMQYLLTNKSAGVGDLAVLFSGEVSEKTLQRDLAQLMIQGRVRAEGEKRWRRYYILDQK